MNQEMMRGNPAQLLRGRIRNLRKRPCRRDFLFTATDRAKMGATAIAAGLTGLGGVAAGLGAMSIDTTEEADLLAFELDGKPVKAWVWVSVFEEGDEVEVVAEPDTDGWLAYGIRRTNDHIVALHPHCSRGRYAHYKASFLWACKIVGTLFLASFLMEVVVAISRGVRSHDLALFALIAIAGGLLGAVILGR